MSTRVKGRNVRPASTGRVRPIPRNGIPQNETKKRVGNYILGNTVGEGTFGKVKIAVHIPTGEKVAVKILEKKRIQDQADVRRVNREIKILKKARHSNIVQLYEVLDTPNSIYLIMENADSGEMFDYIVANRHVPERQACMLFHQLLNGVEELHDNEITHRDLKPENLLLKQSPRGLLVKIVDFGLSNTHDGGRLLSTACGSPCYAAPEMIAGQKYRGPLADTWSMGVILFALVCGHLPFEDPNTSNLYRKILSGEYRTPKWISPEVKDLIRRILETDPNKRLTIPEIRNHPWCSMIPENMIPHDEVLTVEEAEESRGEVAKRLQEMGLDLQAVMDAVSSKACNSLSAMFYLLSQKELAKSRLTKKSSSHSSHPETSAQAEKNAGHVVGGSHRLDAIEKGHIVSPTPQQPQQRQVVQLPPSKTHNHTPSEAVVINKSPVPVKQTIPKLNLGRTVGAGGQEGLVVEGHLSSQSARPTDHSHDAPHTHPVDMMSQTARPDLAPITHALPPADGAAVEGVSSPQGKRAAPAPLRGLTSAGPTPGSSPSPRGVELGGHDDLNVVANGLINGVELERPATSRSKSRGGNRGSGGEDGPGMGKIPSKELVGPPTHHAPTSVVYPHAPKQPQRSGGSAAGRRGRHVTSAGGGRVGGEPKPPVNKPNSRNSGRQYQGQGISGRTIQPAAMKHADVAHSNEAPAVSAPSPTKPVPGKPYAREMAHRNKQSAQQGNIQIGHDTNSQQQQQQPKVLMI